MGGIRGEYKERLKETVSMSRFKRGAGRGSRGATLVGKKRSHQKGYRPETHLLTSEGLTPKKSGGGERHSLDLGEKRKNSSRNLLRRRTRVRRGGLNKGARGT